MTDKTRPTITKAERRACFLEGAQDARYQAYEAIENCADDGTCNFDMCIFRKEKFFTEAEYAEIFADAGLSIRKYAKGWFCVNEFHGMAWRNTAFDRTLARVLKENGYETSMHYQID